MKKRYDKLVRDEMPVIYEDDVKRGITAKGYSIRYMERKETLDRLKDKLLEEANEVFEAYGGDPERLKEEIADVIEVIDAILHHNDISLAEVLEIRDAKRRKKGGFEKGVFLEWIEYIDEEGGQ